MNSRLLITQQTANTDKELKLYQYKSIKEVIVLRKIIEIRKE